MDVDASERRAGGGGRGSHETPAGSAATGCGPMIDKRAGLYQIEEPEAPAKREVLHISGIRSHGAAEMRRVERPWPRQLNWRGFLRRKKSPKTGV
jgi:hypothetical protein